jgi:hypothetical protein
MGNCNCKHGTGQATTCPECDILQMARNHYFTGKLLVERDFTDEQRYTMGKLRRHNQHLHGWGVACGLKVKEHPNPACQAQYVVIEPGTAIDCCGREILLQHEAYFDFEEKFLANWQQQNGPNSQPDGNAHVLQICISYRECPTEQVPAIFDDCSSGTGACQPNRILEGHSFDVIIDPSNLDYDPQAVSLQWEFTKNIANVVCTAQDSDSGRLYVLTSATSGGTANAALYVIDTQNYSLAASANFTGSAGLALAIDSSGQYVYAAAQPSTAGAAPQLYVYAAAGDFTTTVNQVAVGAVSDSTLQLVAIPAVEGALLAYGQTAGFVVMNGLNAAAPSQVVNSLGGAVVPSSMVLSELGTYGFVASSGSNVISVVQIAGETVTLVPALAIPLPAGAQPISLAIASTKNGETLAALDKTAQTLYFVTIPSAGPASATVLTQTATGFAYPPQQVLLSPGGRWAYVLEQNTTATSSTAYLQAVDEHAVASSSASVLGAPIAVGIAATSESLSQDGRHLYVSFNDPAQSNMGGVAIVDVLQADCGDIFKYLIDGCPDCSQGNCLVLATIPGYICQASVVNKEIHNLEGRRLLPSTDLLFKAIECLIEKTPTTGTAGTTGAAGTPGLNGATWYEGSGPPPAALGNNNDFYLNTAAGAGDGDVYQKQAGVWVKVGNIEGPAGANGVGITAVDPTFVPCSTPGAASLTSNPTGLTLNLTIPGCCNTSFVTIKSVSWNGNGKTISTSELEKGVGIAFSGNVEAEDLTVNSIAVLFPVPNGTLTSWQEATLRIEAGNFATVGDVSSPFTAASGNVNGVHVAVDTAPAVAAGLKSARIVVRGDFVRDASSDRYAIDGDHLPPWLPTRPTGDGIEGGTFESWIALVQ